MSTQITLTIVGSGRVARRLGQAFWRAGVKIVGVHARGVSDREQLALELRAAPAGITDTIAACDVVLIAVSDDAVGAVADQLQVQDSLVVHTSGTQGIELLSMHPRHGVLWPIQTLSTGKVAMQDVPIVIETNVTEDLQLLERLAGAISGHVVVLHGEARLALHQAAVMASNFPVHLLQLAQEMAAEEGVDPALLLPLWKGTMEKAAEIGPEKALTGPARRGDLGTIRKHLARSKNDPEIHDLYERLSRSILLRYHPKLGKEEL